MSRFPFRGADYKTSRPAPSRHFDRSEAEWRNLLPPMVHEAWRREISRLRVSWERFPSAPYRHAAPLEMTVLAAPLSSFRPKRSGVEKSHAPNDRKAGPRPPSFRPQRSGVEKSPSSDGTGGITVEDLSTQSIMGAFSICPIPTRSPARDDDGSGQHTVISEGANDKNAAPHPRHFDRSEAEWRNLTPLMTEKPAPIPVISTEAKRSGEISRP